MNAAIQTDNTKNTTITKPPTINSVPTSPNQRANGSLFNNTSSRNNTASLRNSTPHLQRPTSFGSELPSICLQNGHSSTPNGYGNPTRIPVVKPTSCPSPNVLRRAGSMRMRGDRSTRCAFTTPSSPWGGPGGDGGDSNKACAEAARRGQRVTGVQYRKGSASTGPCTPAYNTAENYYQAKGGGASASGARFVTVGTNNPAASLNKSPGRSPDKTYDTVAINGSPSRQRSLSLSLSSTASQTCPRTPPVSPSEPLLLDGPDDDDLDSLHSYSSVASIASCDHAYVARNGTTFSGRKMKYVVHCSTHAGQTGDEYLTPTQRAQRQIRRLKALLQQAKVDLEQKDSDIFRLTKEVVELRLYKASLSSPDEKSTSSEAVTVRENSPESPAPAPVPLELQSSCADSGHFEDLASASPYHQQHQTKEDKACATDFEDRDEERKKLIEYYEKKLQDLVRSHGDQTQELKRQHNDRVEALLKTLSDVNERYCQLVPDYETARERIRELEKQLDDVSSQLHASEEKQKKMYLQMYQNQQKIPIDNGHDWPDTTTAEASTSTAVQGTTRVSVSDLLHQLQVTQTELDNIKDVCQTADQYATNAQTLLSAKEAVSLWVLGARKAMYRRLLEAKGNKSDLDPEVTLQFLKSAIYYFLTDKENHRGHLRAIESILGFSHDEIANIDKANIS